MAKLKMFAPSKKPYRVYLPDELLAEGFIGNLDIIADAFTATIIKPGTDEGKVIDSLAIVIKDLGLRAGKKITVTIGKEEGK